MEIHDLYLDLLKKALNNYLYLGGDTPFEQYDTIGLYDPALSEWKVPASSQPHSLSSTPKLEVLQSLMLDVVNNAVPGDFIEAGVYKGGTVIFMRGFLLAHAIEDRLVWAADSFSGIPLSRNARELNDPVDQWKDRWVAGLEDVRATFKRYGLLDQQVRFLPGKFSDTLPTAHFGKIALARLDGDSYESTFDALEHIYPSMACGGYIIIDDWHLPKCVQAVGDYRQRHAITDPIQLVLNPARVEVVYEAFWRVDHPLSAAT